MRRTALWVLALAILAAACSSGPGGTRAATPSTAPLRSSPPPTPFCRRLTTLDARLRAVRSLSDTTASVARYAESAVGLDLAFRRMRAAAPQGFDIAPVEYANGRFGEIVRGMPPDLDGPTARSQVALILESYNAALYGALVKRCGPGSVGASG